MGGGRGRGNEGKALWILNESVPTQVPIETGLSDGAYTEIASGDLKEGDSVIVDATVAGKDPASAAPTATMRRAPF